jgi:hypothetical protein
MDWDDVEKQSEEDIAYVREDVVLGLVDALNHWKNAKTLASMHLEMENFEAALKALEDPDV